MLCSQPPLDGSGVLVSEGAHGLLSLFSSKPGSEIPEDLKKRGGERVPLQRKVGDF